MLAGVEGAVMVFSEATDHQLDADADASELLLSFMEPQ